MNAAYIPLYLWIVHASFVVNTCVPLASEAATAQPRRTLPRLSAPSSGLKWTSLPGACLYGVVGVKARTEASLHETSSKEPPNSLVGGIGEPRPPHGARLLDAHILENGLLRAVSPSCRRKKR
jgi:hypothetical protein